MACDDASPLKVKILNRDTHTQVPGFIQTKFEITTIVHIGAAYIKKGTRCADCAIKSIEYEAANMMNRGVEIKKEQQALQVIHKSYLSIKREE